LTAIERDEKIKSYFRQILESVKDNLEDNYKELPNYNEMKTHLDILIPHKYDGFRGVVMTVIGGIHLDNNYKPLSDFYACNPRPIFERGIYYILEEFLIPSGKSAPLNVAKGIRKLDDAWIAGRKTGAKNAATSAIKYIEILLDSNEHYNEVVKYFFYRLDGFAETIRNTTIEDIDVNSESKMSLANKIVKFTLDYPEAGTIPQVVIGKLLRLTIEKDDKKVDGEDESVFGTNTTSQKPADIWIEDSERNNLILYEITVKKIDYKRLDDCVHTLKAQGVDNEINFICRIPNDISDIAIENDTLNYKGQWFNFIDISNFIKNSFILLTDEEVKTFFDEMKLFIEDIKRPIIIKTGWNNIFESEE
jgi:predicted nucleic acid-binding protein